MASSWGLYGPGVQAWRAMSLSTEAPWFLFTFVVKCGDEGVIQTVAVGWESHLIDLVQSITPDDRRAVFCVRRPDSPYRWQMRAVEEIWQASPSEAEMTRFLFKFEGEESLSDLYMNTYGPSSGRALLHRCPIDPRHR